MRKARGGRGGVGGRREGSVRVCICLLHVDGRTAPLLCNWRAQHATLRVDLVWDALVWSTLVWNACLRCVCRHVLPARHAHARHAHASMPTHPCMHPGAPCMRAFIPCIHARASSLQGRRNQHAVPGCPAAHTKPRTPNPQTTHVQPSNHACPTLKPRTFNTNHARPILNPRTLNTNHARPTLKPRALSRPRTPNPARSIQSTRANLKPRTPTHLRTHLPTCACLARAAWAATLTTATARLPATCASCTRTFSPWRWRPSRCWTLRAAATVRTATGERGPMA
eukprot:363544-Chlamydomonas_euryale.AAC.15